MAVNPTPAAPVDHGLGVAPGPDPGPPPAPPEVDIPEPPLVAEAGVTTSEWKAMLGFAVQELAVGTTTVVGKLGGQIDNQTALLIGGFELGLLFLGGAYIISRGIRKLGTTA